MPEASFVPSHVVFMISVVVQDAMHKGGRGIPHQSELAGPPAGADA